MEQHAIALLCTVVGHARRGTSPAKQESRGDYAADLHIVRVHESRHAGQRDHGGHSVAVCLLRSDIQNPSEPLAIASRARCSGASDPQCSPSFPQPPVSELRRSTGGSNVSRQERHCAVLPGMSPRLERHPRRPGEADESGLLGGLPASTCDLRSLAEIIGGTGPIRILEPKTMLEEPRRNDAAALHNELGYRTQRASTTHATGKFLLDWLAYIDS